MNHSILRNTVHAIYIFVAMTCFISCHDECDEIEFSTFFKGKLDDQELEGDGIAFTRDDQALHIRLVAGDYVFHHQIDIIINTLSSGSYMIKGGKGHLAEVHELDAIGNSFESNGRSTDFMHLTIDLDKGYVEGNFEFDGFDAHDFSKITLSGSFRVQIGKSDGAWDCGFLKIKPDSQCCRFID